ncbi:putative transcription factor WD40-like family [Helianthus anomalus]
MSSQRITEYERKRLENIKRNDELLASLKIKSKLADLSSSAKRHRVETKSYKLSPEKKARSETPIVIRRSLRTQGKAPDLSGLKDDFSEPTKKSTTLKSQVSPNQSPKKLEPISMRDANTCSESDETLVNKILSVCKGSGLDGDGERKCRVRVSVDLESMELAPENVARVVPNRILSVKFFPSAGLRMVVVGNKFGNLGFWNVDSDNEDGDGDGIYLYQPHPSPVLDDKIGVLSGANYEDEFMLYHYNQTGRWLSSFKGVWGWDDSYIFVGNMKRGVDVISIEQRRLVATLESPHMTAIPCRFDPHPFYPGMLAGATSGGQVYIWT